MTRCVSPALIDMEINMPPQSRVKYRIEIEQANGNATSRTHGVGQDWVVQQPFLPPSPQPLVIVVVIVVVDISAA